MHSMNLNNKAQHTTILLLDAGSICLNEIVVCDNIFKILEISGCDNIFKILETV